jgi:hypothetical protein
MTPMVSNNAKPIGVKKMKKLITVAQFGTVRDVKEESGKFYAWNESRREWYRIAKTKVKVAA